MLNLRNKSNELKVKKGRFKTNFNTKKSKWFKWFSFFIQPASLIAINNHFAECKINNNYDQLALKRIAIILLIGPHTFDFIRISHVKIIAS